MNSNEIELPGFSNEVYDHAMRLEPLDENRYIDEKQFGETERADENRARFFRRQVNGGFQSAKIILPLINGAFPSTKRR